MAGDIYLKLTDVEGESKAKGHEKEIQVESFSWGESNATSFTHGGGGGAGKVVMHDVNFTKVVDKASTNLGLFCATGKHLPTALFTFRKAGEDAREFLKITLEDVMISGYQLADSSGSGQPHESVTLAFAKIKVEYAPQNSKGGLDPSVKWGYDITAGKKI